MVQLVDIFYRDGFPGLNPDDIEGFLSNEGPLDRRDTEVPAISDPAMHLPLLHMSGLSSREGVWILHFT